MSCLRVGGKTELGGCHRGRPEPALGDKSDGRPPSPVHTLLNMGLGEVGETTTLHSSTWDEETSPEGDEGRPRLTERRAKGEWRGDRESSLARWKRSSHAGVEAVQMAHPPQSGVSESFGIPEKFSARSQM